MRRGIALGAALGLAAGACFVKPDAPSAQQDAGDVSADALGDGSMLMLDAMADATMPACPRYEFDGAAANCGGLGSGSGLISIANGILDIIAPGVSATTSSCTRGTSSFSSVTFDVASITLPIQTSSELFIRTGGMRYGARFYSATEFHPFCGPAEGAPVQWTGGLHLFRISKLATETRLEISDGMVWSTTAVVCPALGSAEIAVEVKRSSNGTDASLSLESVEICP